MQIQVVSKGIDVSAALRERVTERIAEATDKYFGRAGEAHVTVARDGFGFRVDCTLHLPSGTILRTEGHKDDAYLAAEQSLERLEKKLRRYKRRRDDKRSRSHEDAAMLVLQAPVAEPDWDAVGDEETLSGDDDGEPLIIAEAVGELQRLTVKDAVEELMETGAPTLVFRNEAHGGISVIFRRSDGHIGWVDPERTKN
jgi:ribosomal subunit interface protein